MAVGLGMLIGAVACRVDQLVRTPPTLSTENRLALRFTTEPTDADAGEAIRPPVAVAVVDSLGDTVRTFGGKIRLVLGRDGSDSGNATLSGAAYTAPAGGVASFPNLRVDRVGTRYTLVAESDSDGLRAESDSFDVAPSDEPFAAAFTSSCDGLACAFTNTSTDFDDSTDVATWRFGDGATSTARANTAHTYATAGTYSVTLTVTDEGVSDSVTHAVSVSAPANQPPTAAFTSSCSGLTCTFTDQSGDADGSVTAWAWNFGDGNTATSRNPSHTFGSGGTYTVTLTVTDNQGATDQVSHDETVSAPANQPPVVDAGPNESVLVGVSYQLSASFSDPDGDGPWAYTIDWGDGSSSTGSAASQGSISGSHTFVGPGSYQIRVTVTDARGASGSDGKTLSVTL